MPTCSSTDDGGVFLLTGIPHSYNVGMVVVECMWNHCHMYAHFAVCMHALY